MNHIGASTHAGQICSLRVTQRKLDLGAAGFRFETEIHALVGARDRVFSL
jgi:hypothetical protein